LCVATGGVVQLLNGDDDPFNITLSSGGWAGATAAIRGVVSGCNTFVLTPDVSGLGVDGTASLEVVYDCSPMTTPGAGGSITVVPWPVLRVSTSLLTPFISGGRVTAQVDIVRNPSGPLSGVFRVSMAGVTSSEAEVAYTTYTADTLASRLRDALRALPGVQDARVTASGDMRYTPQFQVDYVVPHGYDFPSVEIDLAQLRGSSPSVSVTTIQQGSPRSVSLQRRDSLLA
jgi:hypothetical protein